MKKIIIALIVIALVGIGWYLLGGGTGEAPVVETPVVENPVVETPVVEEKEETVIGTSVEGRDIIAYRYGTGENKVLFVGGLHGGYSWNTSLVGYEMVKHFKANVNAIPEGVQVIVIPVANPDGLAKVVTTEGAFSASAVNPSKTAQVAGRFNANKVDLNRNFDCQWKATGTWQDAPVSGGSAAFSEPEALALKNFIEAEKPAGVVVYYSAAGGVYASACGGAVTAATTELTSVYAKASGYPAHQSFDYYETSGDMVNWLAKNGVPAISVLLTDHVSPEWTKNKAGIEATLSHFAN